MDELEILLYARDIPFDGSDRKVMCFAHVVNICCQHVIGQFTNIELSESVDEFVAQVLECHPDHQTFDDAVKRDPVALGRNIVRVVTGSWDEDSSYASWTGVSSGTGLVLYGMIGSKDCHSRFDVRVRVS